MLVTLVACLASACGSQPSGHEAISCAAQQIYGGSADSGPLEVARGAIVGIEASDGLPMCTGTFVAPDLVLTAAHCALPSGLTIRPVSGEPPIAAAGMLVHPDLDAMVLRVPLPMRLGVPSRSFVALWPGAIGPEWVGTLVTLAGLGRTESGTTGELFFAEEPVANLQATELWVEGAGKSGACDGDSGGPLLARDAHGEVRILGVLSRGSRDCLGTDAYTRIDLLVPWLEDMVGVAREACTE